MAGRSSGGTPLDDVQGQVGGVPLGGVVQREPRLVAHGVIRGGTERLDGSPGSEAGGSGGGVQIGHGSVTLRGIGPGRSSDGASLGGVQGQGAEAHAWLR